MPRRVVVLLGVLAAFLAVVLLISFRRQPPEIPADDVHIGLRGRADDCMACHGPEGVRPRGPNHPFGTQCWSCHYEKGEAR